MSITVMVWYYKGITMKRKHMSDMYIDVMNYIMENSKYGFDPYSDEEIVMVWLLDEGADKVEDILEDMINEYR